MRGKEPLLVFGGAAIAFVGVAFLFAKREDALLELRGAAGPAPAGPSPPGPSGVTGPLQLTEPFFVTPGARYLAAVDLGLFVGVAANASDVAREARKLGFPDASATKTKPAFPIAKGDYYVTASYAGEPRSFPRSNAKGQVTIVDLWRIA